MAPAPSPKTDADLLEMVDHICYVFNQSAAAFAWLRVKEKNPAAITALGKYHSMYGNAALESSLINLRALNEFFRAPSKQHAQRPDDVRATDFPGYVTKGTFLEPDDEKEIHKRLAHLTLRRLTTNPGWQIRRLMDPALVRMLHFLNYLRGNFVPLHHPNFFRIVEACDNLRDYTPIGRIARAILKP